MDVESRDRPRKPKSGFAREKIKRLAAEARAIRAEGELEELEATFSELLALHHSLLDDLKAKKQHPLALQGNAHV